MVSSMFDSDYILISRLEPLLYRTMVIATRTKNGWFPPCSLQDFYAIRSKKEEGFFRRAVKHLCLGDMSSKDMLSVLTICSGVEDICFGGDWTEFFNMANGESRAGIVKLLKRTKSVRPARFVTYVPGA